MTILVIDGMNFLRRANSGFMQGDHYVTFNALRNLRSLVEKIAPKRVYFVLEGRPIKRESAFSEYKANRKIVVEQDGTLSEKMQKKLNDNVKFFRQVDEFVELASSFLPVSVVRHPNHEADDTIYNLISKSSTSASWTVASNDTDFIQLFNRFMNVKVFNPMTDSYVECPDYDYVAWKSLRGDGSDNIPGIPGVGDKTAEKLVKDPALLEDFLAEDAERMATFERNRDLIGFIEWSDDERELLTCSSPTKDWNAVSTCFEQMGFKSLLKEKTWQKFVATFDSLW